MKEILQLIDKVKPSDKSYIPQCQNRWDSLTKPKNSLGKLEGIINQIGAIQNTSRPQINKKIILCFAADHGVVSEGVSPSDQIVTAQMVDNFLKGGAAISVLAQFNRIPLQVTNMGMVHQISNPKLIQSPIAPQTRNITQGPGMTKTQCQKAVLTGFNQAKDFIERSAINLLIPGEMGVGNTSASGAIYSCITGLDPEKITGLGAGLSPKHLDKKIKAIKKAIKVNRIKGDQPLEILTKLGGFELAAMMGVMLAGGVYHRPVIIDGYIAGASAAVLLKLCPPIRDYLIFSHLSNEVGFNLICEKLDIKPLINLDMKLGEGTGATMIIPLLDSALACYNQMSTFAQAGVKEISPC